MAHSPHLTLVAKTARTSSASKPGALGIPPQAIDPILLAEGYMDALEGTVALARCSSYALGWASGLNTWLSDTADQPTDGKPAP